MPIHDSARPKRREGVHAQALPDGSALLFDTVAATAYPITESAARIWRLCDGEHTLAQIVDALEAHYDVARDVVAGDVRKLAEDLTARQLVDLAQDA
jgi:hypothetical protein